MSTYKELLQLARKKLKEQEIGDADVDAWYLLSHVFQINRTEYLLKSDISAAEEESSRYLELVKLRSKHIPLQYITGSQEFMGLEFDVSQDVLIPRQDTEILVEEALKSCDGKTVLDMCTGSGCIIISIAKWGKPLTVTGVDISVKALEIAAKNAIKHGVELELINSDLFERVPYVYDMIISNPPYIPTDDIGELMPEVKNYEPVIALDGSKDGLDFYRRIIAALDKNLCSNGTILFEIGHNQGEAISELLRQQRFMEIKIMKDLSGLDRVVSARKS